MNGEEPMTFLKLPDELVLNCLARVSRLYYPTLSLVSKRFHSLLSSPELYKIRTILGRTESCLYVCLLSYHDFKPYWFTLIRRPNRSSKPRWYTLCFRPKKKKSSDNVFIPIPSTNSPHVSPYSRFAVVGSNIYHIRSKTTKVSFLDCKSHTWHEAPNMMLAQNNPLVSVLDEKIYVNKGVAAYENSSNRIEFFDTKTQIWENLETLRGEGTYITKSLAIQGKLHLHLKTNKHLVYNPKENSWKEDSSLSLMSWVLPGSCVIDDIVYTITWGNANIVWYDDNTTSWRILKGLEGELPKFTGYACVQLANYGGKMAIFWYRGYISKPKIWCAEILLERRNEHEIYGKVEWFSIVLKSPLDVLAIHVIGATI